MSEIEVQKIPSWAHRAILVEIPLEPLPSVNADGLLPEYVPIGEDCSGSTYLYWRDSGDGDGEKLCPTCANRALQTDNPPKWCSAYVVGIGTCCDDCGDVIEAAAKPELGWVDSREDYVNLAFPECD